MGEAAILEGRGEGAPQAQQERPGVGFVAWGTPWGGQG